jgi:hypothetical protein
VQWLIGEGEWRGHGCLGARSSGLRFVLEGVAMAVIVNCCVIADLGIGCRIGWRTVAVVMSDLLGVVMKLGRNNGFWVVDW